MMLGFSTELKLNHSVIYPIEKMREYKIHEKDAFPSMDTSYAKTSKIFRSPDIPRL